MHYSRLYDQVIIPKKTCSMLHRTAVTYSDVEVSGIVLGNLNAKTLTVHKVLFGEKTEWKTNSFTITSPKLLKYFAGPRKHKDKFLGVFHAHPNDELFPSFEDIKGMIITNVPWLIFKNIGKTIAINAFIFEEDVVRKIRVIKTYK